MADDVLVAVLNIIGRCGAAEAAGLVEDVLQIQAQGYRFYALVQLHVPQE